MPQLGDEDIDYLYEVHSCLGAGVTGRGEGMCTGMGTCMGTGMGTGGVGGVYQFRVEYSAVC